jgi:hypothetical protein
LLGGVFIDWIGLSGTLLVQAVGFAAAGVVMILLPSLKLFDRPQGTEEPAAQAQPAVPADQSQ